MTPADRLARRLGEDPYVLQNVLTRLDVVVDVIDIDRPIPLWPVDAQPTETFS